MGKSQERTEEEITAALSEVTVQDEAEKANEVNKLFYKRIARHYLGDEVRKDNREAVLTAAAYHKKTKILVTGKKILFNLFLQSDLIVFNRLFNRSVLYPRITGS